MEYKLSVVLLMILWKFSITEGYLRFIGEDVNWQNDCKNLNLNWLQLRNHFNCVQLIIPSGMDTNFATCLELAIRSNKLILNTKSYGVNLTKPDSGLCNHYIIPQSRDAGVTTIWKEEYNKITTFSRIFIILEFNNCNEFLNSKAWMEFYFNKTLHIACIQYSDYSFKYIVNGYTGVNITLPASNTNVMKILSRDVDHPLFDPQYNIFKDNFSVSMFNCPPYVIYVDETKFMFDGLEFRIFAEVTKAWNISYKLHDVDFHDPWNSVLEAVRNGTSDIGFCSLWQSIHRYKIVDFTRHYDSQCNTFLIPKPTPLTEYSYIYEPFDLHVWIFILFSYLFCGTSIIIVTIIGARQNDNDHEESPRNNDFFLIFLELLDILTNHCIYEYPKRSSIQIILLIWIISSVLMNTYYSTIYSSMLTSPIYTPSLDTIDDLVKAKNVKWDGIGTNLIVNEFKLSTIKAYRDLIKQVMDPPSQNIRRDLLAGNYVYSVKVLSNSYVTDSDMIADVADRFRLMKECYYNYYLGFVVQQNSPYARMFNMKISYYVEAGFTQRWASEMYAKYGKLYMKQFFEKVKEEHFDKSRQLSIENLSGGFILFLYGISLSVLSFISELARYYFNTRAQN